MKKMALLIAALAALALGGLHWSAKAAPPSDAEPTISLDQAAPALGDTVTFTTVAPNNVRIPRVEVLCYQGGQLVYGEGGDPADSFLLGGGGSLWKDTGGAADCVANLYYFTHKAGQPDTVYLATTEFHAAG